MDKPVTPLPTPKRPAYMWIALFVGVILLGIFSWVYWSEPVTNLQIPNSEYWNDKTGDVLTLVPALAVAILGVILTRQFKPSEPPFRIWLTFTLGWWMWLGGELLGFIYDYFYWFSEYPEFTFIDLCWLLGYIFFGLSLYYQFRLIYNWQRAGNTAFYLGYILLAGIIGVGLTKLAIAAGLGEGYSWLAVYLAVLYPIFDIAEGGAALWLFFLFGRGYLGRPWWGLILFAIADSFNIFFWMGGYEWIADPVYLGLDMLSAATYIGGYILTALALLSAISHIQRGRTIAAPNSLETAGD